MSDFRKYINIYEFETTLPGSGEKVKFRPVTTGQMKRLLVYENETDPDRVEDALDELISTSVIDDDFNIKNLYLQDRFFLLLEIRKYSKGNTYQFDVKCPKCNSQSLQVVKIDEMELKKLPDDYNRTIKLSDELSITMDHITRGAQSASFDIVSKIKGEMTELQRMAETALVANALVINSIITPEGEDRNISLEDKQYLLENIPRSMYENVSSWFTENEFGVDFTFSVDCKHMKPSGKKGVPAKKCDYSERVDIPLSDFFF